MWREGEVELVSLTLDTLSLGCWWKIEVCLSSRQLYTELRSGLETENSHQHEEVMKPEELMRSLGGVGRGARSLCGSQKGARMGFKEFMKWVQYFLKNLSYLLRILP